MQSLNLEAAPIKTGLSDEQAAAQSRNLMEVIEKKAESILSSMLPAFAQLRAGKRRDSILSSFTSDWLCEQDVPFLIHRIIDFHPKKALDQLELFDTSIAPSASLLAFVDRKIKELK